MKFHVLVVDDEVTLLNNMVRSLQSVPSIVVTGCSSVDRAITVIENDVPDLLLTDLNISGRVGLELVDLLHKKSPKAPIIVLTAFHSTFKSQLSNYKKLTLLEKPIPLEELKNTILSKLTARSVDQSGIFQLSDYIQLAGMGQHSVTLTIKGLQAETGLIEIFEGTLWNVFCGELSGLAALSTLMNMPIIGIDYGKLDHPPETRNVHQRWDVVLLSILREKDEETRRYDRLNLLDDDTSTEVPTLQSELPDEQPQLPTAKSESLVSPKLDPETSKARRIESRKFLVDIQELTEELLYGAYDAWHNGEFERSREFLVDFQKHTPDHRAFLSPVVKSILATDNFATPKPASTEPSIVFIDVSGNLITDIKHSLEDLYEQKSLTPPNCIRITAEQWLKNDFEADSPLILVIDTDSAKNSVQLSSCGISLIMKIRKMTFPWIAISSESDENATSPRLSRLFDATAAYSTETAPEEIALQLFHTATSQRRIQTEFQTIEHICLAHEMGVTCVITSIQQEGLGGIVTLQNGEFWTAELWNSDIEGSDALQEILSWTGSKTFLERVREPRPRSVNSSIFDVFNNLAITVSLTPQFSIHTLKWLFAKEKIMASLNSICQEVLDDVDDALACGVVDLHTGMMMGVHHTVPYFTQAYLDAVAAAAVDMFRGKNVRRVEKLLSKTRGINVEDSFEEIFVNSSKVFHFMKVIKEKHAVVVLVTKKTTNQGMGWASLRNSLPDITDALP